MYLKSLEIKGFKSFAEHTEIELEPGLNFIVGPNGCGKSNIVDSIKWVLGEANVRHLRGQKSEDVIFNGTDSKRALGMAWVDIVIDNSDHTLPLDFEELTISRKVFRSGESEFYLNNSRVRMRDINQLFTGTGLGKKGYSIVSQGELEEILNGDPLDRRLMLEEASGVIKYRQQRDEARNRLLLARNDLDTMTVLLAELERREQELGLKAQRAQTYLAAQEECRTLEQRILASEIDAGQKRLASTRAEVSHSQRALGELQQQLKDLDKKWEIEEGFLEEKKNLLFAQKESRYQKEMEIKALESELRLGRERLKNYQERLATAIQGSDKYGTMLGNVENDLQVKIDDLTAEREIFQQQTVQIEGLQKKICHLEGLLKEGAEDYEMRRQLLFEQVERETRIRNEVVDREDKIRLARNKQERIAIHLQDNQDKLNKWREQNSEFEAMLKTKWQCIQQGQELIAELETEHEKLRQAWELLEPQNNKIKREILDLGHRLSIWQEALDKRIGYSEGVRAIMQVFTSSQKTTFSGIKGLVADLIEVPAGMELAINVAVGRGLENIVVSNVRDAREAIAFLKRRNLGRVTFLPLDSLKVRKIPMTIVNDIKSHEGVLGLASRLLIFDTAYEKAIEYLLGNVLVVSDLEKGWQVFKQSTYPFRIVTLEGELINGSGAISGGGLAKAKDSPLMRKREGKRIQQQLQELHEKENAWGVQLDQLTQQIKDVRIGLEEAKKKLAENRFEYRMTKDLAEARSSDINKANTDRKTYQEEISQLEKAIGQWEQELKELQKDCQVLAQENAMRNKELEKSKDSRENIRRDYEVSKERYLSCQDQLAMKKRELEKLQLNIKQFEQIKLSYQQSEGENRTLQESLRKEIESESNRVEFVARSIEDKKRVLADLIQTIQINQSQSKEQDQKIGRLRDQALSVKAEIELKEEKLKTLEIRTARLDSDLSGLLNKWEEKFRDGKPLDFPELCSPMDVQKGKKRIYYLQEELQTLGPVDTDAIGEYAALKERLGFLQQQYNDLQVAEKSLQELLKESEKQMAKNFRQFLVLANESFRRTFVEIFAGGEANLEIEAESEYLSAGVDIVVKMPGKRKQSLNLLSGGERALTCIAFIFSLLRLKPVPFCLLDEIDASLDESNLQKFTSYLKKMAGNIQFIIITHRQATIEAGDRVYGVTMPQEGVSSVLFLSSGELESIA